MPACQSVFTDEDEKALDEALERAKRNENLTIDKKLHEIFESSEFKVKIVDTIERRNIECLEENAEGNKKYLQQRIAQADRSPSNLEKLDLNTQPTPKDLLVMQSTAKELEMRPWKFINIPVISATPDLQNRENYIRQGMLAISKSKLNERFRDIEVVDKILFVDKQELGSEPSTIRRGAVLGKKHYIQNLELSRTVFIFRDEKGKLPENKYLQRIITHELCHLNLFKSWLDDTPGDFEKVFLDHLTEWEKACEAQISGPGVVSERAAKCIPISGPVEQAFTDPEFIAEHIAFWDSELDVEFSEEMWDFFEKYLK